MLCRKEAESLAVCWFTERGILPCSTLLIASQSRYHVTAATCNLPDLSCEESAQPSPAHDVDEIVLNHNICIVVLSF